MSPSPGSLCPIGSLLHRPLDASRGIYYLKAVRFVRLAQVFMTCLVVLYGSHLYDYTMIRCGGMNNNDNKKKKYKIKSNQTSTLLVYILVSERITSSEVKKLHD